ncbi:MAG: chromate transporter, partial [Phascolarctobacterium sp.]|nr:chromate transporter [Phascolarctobacterium sp.]
MIYWELFWSFVQVGAFCVGGGYASMPLIQEQVIERHGWLTLQQFIDIFTISQMTPGPIGINAATFVALVAALIHGKSITVVNVGDSRAYLVDGNGINQITTDHSLVQMMISRGELTQEKAKHYPGKNLITRAIGTEPQVICDIFHRRVDKGASFLLCTDGLSNLLDDQEILFEVVYGQDKAQCCQRLLDIA